MRRRLLALLALPLLGLAGCQTDLALVDLKERWAGPNSRFLPMDGIEVHWRDEGPGSAAPGVRTGEPAAASTPSPASPAAPASGAASAASASMSPPAPGAPFAEPPAILLLHGTASSLHTWDGWARAMSPTMRVVRLDLPGFGLTGPHPSGDYSGAATADFLERFANAAGLKRFAIAGNSLGGYYAWRFALRHPERVSALILVDAVGYPIQPGTGESVAMQLARMPVVSELMRFAPIRGIVERSLKETYVDGTKVTPALVDRYEQLMLRPGNRAAMGDRARAERRPIGWQRLSELRMPTLIQWGEADAWIPMSHAERFRQDIPNSRLVVYPGLGHLPMEEDPDTTVRDAMIFLRGGTVPGQK
ncbi:MAG: alpha/beta hydrolase [Burkholderiales bacterium]|jgi:pimeloyl-ACP methyl ester carboxylesterase